MNDPTLERHNDGFRAISDTELLVNTVDVRFYGAFGDEKRRADLFIALTLGHQLQDLDLSCCQRRAGLGASHQPCRDFRRDVSRSIYFRAFSTHFANSIHIAAGSPSFEKLTRSSLFPFALQDEGRPIIWGSPLFLFPERQLSLT